MKTVKGHYGISPDYQPPTIIHLDYTKFMGRTDVKGYLTNNLWVDLFSYYEDELTFQDYELIGLTAAEARKLHQTKDIAYLQS
jgi:hypothetical protein